MKRPAILVAFVIGLALGIVASAWWYAARLGGLQGELTRAREQCDTWRELAADYEQEIRTMEAEQ